jgi:excisionase family DNA binding protein
MDTLRGARARIASESAPAMDSNSTLANSITSAAQRLGIGRTLIYQLIDRGDLRAIKIGGRTLIPESELKRFLESRLADKVA